MNQDAPIIFAIGFFCLFGLLIYLDGDDDLNNPCKENPPKHEALTHVLYTPTNEVVRIEWVSTLKIVCREHGGPKYKIRFKDGVTATVPWGKLEELK